jgi:hypothetical protein
MARAAVESPEVTRRSNRRGMRWVRSSRTCRSGERDRHEDGVVGYLLQEARRLILETINYGPCANAVLLT